MKYQLLVIANELPDNLLSLRAEARTEGFRFIERLHDEWERGVNRFDKPNEQLIYATNGERAVGIGGITIDPKMPNALRMRRFYIIPKFRRTGLAKSITTHLIEQVDDKAIPIVVHAGTKIAPAFWEAIGFSPDQCFDHTHVLKG